MPCQIKNPANIDLAPIEPHVNGMYDHFNQKYGFSKPPVMVFDSDPSNQPNVLGKTAYYDPSTLEIHVYTDGRHPKDMLRSIAHELIHHRQNLEGRLDVGGYHGEGYYLKNEELKKLEQEAMKDGNETLREYEDNLKLRRNEQMSLKEWKNNELNRLLLEKFGISKEELSEVEEDEEKDELDEQSKSDLEDRGARRAAGGRRLDEEQEEEELEEGKGKFDDGDGKDEKCDHVPCKDAEEETKNENLQETIQKVLKSNKKIRLRFK
jgi:hypothetical protein